MNIVDILEDNVTRYPDYDKLFYRNEIWSNHKLHKYSVQLAGVLKQKGVAKGDRVCLILPVNPYAHVTAAATWRIGGILAPLHFVNPAPAQKDLLDFLQPKVVVTTAAKAAELATLAVNPAIQFFVVDSTESTARVESISQMIESFTGSAPDIENCKADDPALILSTSGSTGKPKSAISSHGNWVNSHETAKRSRHLKDSQFVFHFEDGCSQLEAGSYGHVAIMLGVVRSWAMKTRVIFFEQKNGDLLKTLQDFKITIGGGVPAVFEQLAALPTWSNYNLNSVRYWTSSSAPLTESRREFIEKKLGIKIIQNYAMTETCGFVTSETSEQRRPGSSGKVKAGFELKTIDDNGKTMPPGEVGEICVKGASVILGYYKSPDETARAFKDGWYHTGDLGSIDHDGFIYIVGRKSQVINQGGFKIQPVEVQQVVETFPAVGSCVVTAIPDELLGQAVGVFIKVKKGVEFEAKDLRAFCVQHLADYKVPQYVYVVDEFPLTVSNKVDIQKLVRERNSFVAETGGAAPKSHADLVTLIKDVLAGILGVEAASLKEKQPLMEAGMTSRMSVAFASTLGSMIGRSLPSTLIFSHPTIGEIANFLGREKLEKLEKKAQSTKKSSPLSEDIAIVGMSLRYPGGSDSPESFWNLLASGQNTSGPIPQMRWANEEYYDADKNAPMKSYVKAGNFVEDIEKFDRKFFDMSPLQATATDPQHRLLMEAGWEALEDAGLTQEKIAKSRGGVYLGMLGNDYQEYLVNSDMAIQNPELLLGGGSGLAGAPARLSYTFGLQGPCMTVMTTCSSSLVAIDLAIKDLRSGACDFAVAGGVCFHISPWGFVSLSKMGAVSVDGVCKTFDASADGYGRGDGLGLLILKPLSKAEADGDRIWALIKGTAVNQNGRGTSPTAPSVSAQANLLQDALNNAGVNAADVSYVEAHGTGTLLGDPIEMSAIAEVYGAREKDNVLHIGSAKTNIGHTESAAGVAGVIKTVLAMHHKKIPAHLHFKKLNPMIGDLNQIPAKIPTQTTDWNPKSGKRIAGVSSFGITGTNSHVILEEFVEVPPADFKGPDFPILTFSGKSREAVVGMAKKYEYYLSTEGKANRYSDICYSSNQHRTHFKHRFAVVAKSHDEAVKMLQAANGIEGEVSSDDAPHLAFLFTGQGSQYRGMGQDLFASSQIFKDAIERCAKVFKSITSRDLTDLLFHDKSGAIDQTEFAQPALFALEYALAQYWMNLGVQPKAMLGHSLGEYVAATVAGVFSVEDAMLLVVTRARLMQNAPGVGGMASIEAGGAEAEKFIAGYKSVSIAAFNAPKRTVISGDKSTVERIMKELQAKGVRSKALNVSHAFHSPLMEPILKELDQTLAKIKMSKPSIPIVSNLTGKIVDDEICKPSYWLLHLRAPVSFQQGIETLVQNGFTAFLEIGPVPTLSGMAQLCVAATEGLKWRWSMQKDKPEREQVAKCMAGLYADGVEVNWSVWNSSQGYRVRLPSYAFQRESYWPSRIGAVGNKQASNVIPLAAKIFSDKELKRHIGESIKNVLGSEITDADWSKSLTELGMNSISAMTLRSELSVALGNQFKLPQTFAFDHPTAESMLAFLQSYSQTSRSSEQAKTNRWLRIVKPRPNASMRLFCFHYAGGAAQLFDTWAAQFDDSIEVCAVQLPGRWERSGEHLISNMKELAQAVYHGLKGETEKPFVVFGYSFGALTAVHWLDQIKKRGGREPVMFFPAASSPPQLLEKKFKAPSAKMSDDEFFEKFGVFFGSSIQELKKSSEHRAKFVPLIKADLAAAFSAYLDVDPRFQFPIHAFGGKEDPTLPGPKLRKWAAVTEGTCEITTLKGAHFFIQGPSGKSMIAQIAKALPKPRARRRKA